MRLHYILFALSLITTPCLAEEKPATDAKNKVQTEPLPSYTLLKEKSFLKFFAIQNGAPVEGRFSDFSTEIHFDKDRLDESTIKAEVNVASLQTGNQEIEDNLKKNEWLGIDAYPKAKLAAGKLKHMPMSDGYYADGTITLKGKTLPIKLNFQLEKEGQGYAIATGYITLQRSDFGIGTGEWAKDDVLKNEVRVEFRIYAEKH